MPPKRAARAAVDAQEGAPASKRKQASRAGSGATKSAVPDAPVAVASKRAAGNAAASAAAGRRGKAASGKAASGGAAAAEVAAGAAPAAAPGGGRQFFLMKSEPDVFSIDDLEGRPGQTEPWDGVRSHQAKKAFFYHSNAKPPGVVGIVEIVREAYPDPSQFDPGSKYYDASCEREAPKWVQIPLEELKQHKGGALSSMALFRQGRLSVQPVTPAEWQFVLCLEDGGGGGKE
eukprot:scaffold8.g1711.t1